MMGGEKGNSSGVGGRYNFSLRITSSAASVSAERSLQGTRLVTAIDLYQRRQDIFSSRRPSFNDSLHFVNTAFRGEVDEEYDTTNV